MLFFLGFFAIFWPFCTVISSHNPVSIVLSEIWVSISSEFLSQSGSSASGAGGEIGASLGLVLISSVSDSGGF